MKQFQNPWEGMGVFCGICREILRWHSKQVGESISGFILAIFLLLHSLQKDVFWYTSIDSLLVVTAQHYALWRVSPIVGHCGVDTSHMRTSEGNFGVCLFARNVWYRRTVSTRWVTGSWWPPAIATNLAWHGSWHISSPWLRLNGFPRDCELLTTAIARPTVERQSSWGDERFPREARSIEIWWSWLVDGKEPVCPFAGTFVVIVGALVTWAIFIPRDNSCYDQAWS